jgi:hypothetical protein
MGFDCPIVLNCSAFAGLSGETTDSPYRFPEKLTIQPVKPSGFLYNYGYQ